MDLTNNQRFKSKTLAGIDFPPVPFQAIVKNKEYARKYALAEKKILVVTDVYYDQKEARIKFSVLEALFDFPWCENGLEILLMFKPN
jgi:hypothetical protein